MMVTLRNIIRMVVFLHFFAGTILMAQWHENYKNALNAFPKKQWSRAISHLNAAISDKSKPKANAKTYGMHFIDYFPYLYRGIAYYQKGNFDDAQKDLKLSQSFGEVFKGSKDRNAASYLQKYLDALAKRRRIEDTLKQAISLFLQKKYLEAIEKFNVVLSLKPNHPEAKKYVKRAKSQIAIEKKFTEGVSLLNQKDYEAAIKIFEEVKQQNPKYPRIDQYIGRARNALNRIAREEVQKSTEKKRRDQIDRLLRQGENLFKQNKLDEAEVKFSFVLQIASNHPRALRFLDKIKEGRRQENIIQEFRLAVQFYDQNNLDDAETKFRQVIVMSDGHHVESEEYLEKIRERKLNLNPTATISEAQRKTRAGVSAFYEGDYKKAIVQLEDVARNENNVADVYAFLACAYATKYFLQGEQDSTLYKMAIMRFRKATQLNPNYTLQDKYISPKIIGMFSEKLSRK